MDVPDASIGPCSPEAGMLLWANPKTPKPETSKPGGASETLAGASEPKGCIHMFKNQECYHEPTRKPGNPETQRYVCVCVQKQECYQGPKRPSIPW